MRQVAYFKSHFKAHNEGETEKGKTDRTKTSRTFLCKKTVCHPEANPIKENFVGARQIKFLNFHGSSLFRVESFITNS